MRLPLQLVSLLSLKLAVPATRITGTFQNNSVDGTSAVLMGGWPGFVGRKSTGEETVFQETRGGGDGIGGGIGRRGQVPWHKAGMWVEACVLQVHSGLGDSCRLETPTCASEILCVFEKSVERGWSFQRTPVSQEAPQL